MREDYVGPQGDQLFRQRLRLSAAGRKTNIDAHIAALRPSEPLKLLSKLREARCGVRIILSNAHQHADPAHALALLRPRHQVRELKTVGVEFAACGKMMEVQNVALKDLLPGFIELDQSGVVRLAELQAQGYVYLRL